MRIRCVAIAIECVVLSGTNLALSQTAGNALRFDGSNDMVTFGTVPRVTNHSIEVWIKPEDAAFQIIAGHVAGPGQACTLGMYLAMSAQGACYNVDVSGCGNGAIICGGVALRSWTHVAGTYDGNTMRLYLNGVLANEQSNVGFNSSNFMSAGAVVFFNGTQSHYRGELDELRVWNRARSPGEIDQAMRRSLTGSEQGLAGYWRFDEDSGQQVQDLSPAGITGVLGRNGNTESSDPARVASTAPLEVGGVISGLRFVPVTPCRIADTRLANGPFGGPRLPAGGTRSFTVPSSPCGIPPTAVSYSLNFTVVPAGPLSFATLFPTGQARPFASTINSFDGRIRANAANVPAGAGGAVSVFATDATDVVLDINGYFETMVNPGNLSFFPLIPCRAVDTRTAPGSLGGPGFLAGQTRTFSLQGVCGLPINAQAYSLNVTVVPAGPLSFLTTWPSGQPRPLVSTLNAFTGAVTANAAIVPAGNSGAIDVFVTDETNVIVDVNGYFAPPAPGGLSLYTVSPCRVSDTRTAASPLGGPILAANETRQIPVPAANCGVLQAQAYSLNATVVPAGSLGFLTLWPAGGLRPIVSTLNSFDGAIVANAALVPAGTNGILSAFVTDMTDLVLDINGFFAP